MSPRRLKAVEEEREEFAPSPEALASRHLVFGHRRPLAHCRICAQIAASGLTRQGQTAVTAASETPSDSAKITSGN